jgi:hypothetical protein
MGIFILPDSGEEPALATVYSLAIPLGVAPSGTHRIAVAGGEHADLMPEYRGVCHRFI